MADTYTYQASTFPGWPGFVIESPGDACIPCVLDNRDYQTFLAWMAEGNPAPAGWTGPTNTVAPTG